MNGTATLRRNNCDFLQPFPATEPCSSLPRRLLAEMPISVAWPRRRKGAGGGPLRESQKGGRLSSQAIRRVIDGVVGTASARQLVPTDANAHTLRHTFAMFYLKDNPGNLVGLATLLGHSSLDTTRIYAQHSAEYLASRVDRLALNAYTE